MTGFLDPNLDFETKKKKKRFVDLGHGVIRRDAFRFVLKVKFSGEVWSSLSGAPQKKVRWTSIVEHLFVKYSGLVDGTFHAPDTNHL